MGLLVALRRPAPFHGRETLLTSPEQPTVAAAPPTVAATRRLPATPLQRLGDGFALGLIVGGAALFLYARYQLQLLAANHIKREEGHWAVEQFTHWWRLSNAGLWTAGVGLALAVVLALWQWRRTSSLARQ